MVRRMGTKRMRYLLLLLLGVILVVSGGFFIKEKWAGILIGLGAGLIGMYGAQLITLRVMQLNPTLKRLVAIEHSDERNNQINNYAKAKAFDFAQFLALPFFLVLILTDVSLWVVLLSIFVYMAEWALYLWFLNRRAREM